MCILNYINNNHIVELLRPTFDISQEIMFSYGKIQNTITQTEQLISCICLPIWMLPVYVYICSVIKHIHTANRNAYIMLLMTVED